MREEGVFHGEEVGDGRGAGVGLALEGAFEDEVGTKGVEAYLAGVATFVTVAGGDIHHRRETAAVLGAEATGVDVGIEDDVGLEDRIEAYGVEGIIDDHAIEEAEVLDHGAAADIELTALVAGGVDAGKHLHVLGQVGGATDGWQLLNLRGGDLFDGNLGLCATLFHTVGGDIDGFEHLDGGLEADFDIERAATMDLYLLAIFLKAYGTDLERVFAIGHSREDEETVEVGGDTIAGVGQQDGAKGDSFAGSAAIHGAFDGVLRYHKEGHEEE